MTVYHIIIVSKKLQLLLPRPYFLDFLTQKRIQSGWDLHMDTFYCHVEVLIWMKFWSSVLVDHLRGEMCCSEQHCFVIKRKI